MPALKAPFEDNLATAAKNLCQLLRRNYLKLIISTIARLLVLTPSSKLRGVTKTVSLHVIVRDFDNQLRTQRFPRQVFALTPPTLCSGNPASGLPLFCFKLSPVLPRMIRKRILAIWSEELH